MQSEHAKLKNKEALKCYDGYKHNIVSLTASNNKALLPRNCKPKVSSCEYLNKRPLLPKNKVMQCPLSHAKCNVAVVANKTEYIW